MRCNGRNLRCPPRLEALESRLAPTSHMGPDLPDVQTLATTSVADQTVVLAPVVLSLDRASSSVGAAAAAAPHEHAIDTDSLAALMAQAVAFHYAEASTPIATFALPQHTIQALPPASLPQAPPATFRPTTFGGAGLVITKHEDQAELGDRNGATTADDEPNTDGIRGAEVSPTGAASEKTADVQEQGDSADCEVVRD
ncbi:MAG: hypothetical protein HY040_24860 [Planctomycetes bacterium]|nr:hypothetical protein [Planctomycetota bacterium]